MKYDCVRRLARQKEIILGTRSPRRMALLKETGIEFNQMVPDVEETLLPDEPPFEYAERLARDKALWVSRRVTEGVVVIGCDTIVVLEGKVLQKPADKHEALKILSALSGRQHIVCTALAVADRTGILASGHEQTKVFFNDVTTAQIEEYIATGEPTDKAGAYGIQGMGAFLVDRIEGSLDNVVGLPRRLLEHLAERIVVSG